MIVLLYISVLITIVWDYLNYPNEVAGLIVSKLTNGRIKQVELIKPFGCSLCMTAIISWLYLAFTCIVWCSFTSIVGYTLLAVINGISTNYIYSLILIVNDTINKLLSELDKVFK
jgi:hypothetical protein